MKPIAFAFAAVLLVVQAKTTTDGVYTAAQATRGDAVYARTCTSCHGADLSGDGQAPSLAGKEFVSGWTGQSLADLYERVQATMPGDAPGTLKPEEVSDVIAFILQKNNFPEGAAELASDPKALKDISFVAPKQ
jgi:S-disulfanyl-L-cysteine oxidoreductase SoxD